MHPNDNAHAMDDVAHIPAGFKFFIGAAALFIAGCSAFFSVCGLGMLFIGASTAVMIMAASLEVGKLVAASFLYWFWRHLTIPLRFYLTLAVLALIGITSLGNYGYLARAYERTHTGITVIEDQIASLQKEIADTQRQMDDARNRSVKVSDAGREDVSAVRQRIAQENASFEQALARLQEQRKAVQDRRDRDQQLVTARMSEQAELLRKAVASEDLAMERLQQQIAVLDRAVDAYTKIGGPGILPLGGPGIFRVDGVKRGQELREQQRGERESIAAEIAAHRERQEKLRSEHAKRAESAEAELGAIRTQASQDSGKIDVEEQAQRKAHEESLARIQTQVDSIQNSSVALRNDGDTQLESQYQRIRACNEEIRRLQEKISATDIGSYRFVARAFDAGADSVVKWLILALVLVFDPLAVCLAVGFNVALLRDRRNRFSTPPRAGSGLAVSGDPVPAGAASALARPRNRWLFLGVNVVLIAALAGAVGYGIYRTRVLWRQRAHASHAQWIPADSFAVVTLRPAELAGNPSARNLVDWIGKADPATFASLLDCVNGGGFDPLADVYLFAKFPEGRPAGKDARPVILCGLVARVVGADAAEAALSGIAEKINRSIRPAHGASSPLTRNRAMIQCGQGRYMDSEGGFFTFAITDQAAILLVEFEGNPQAPSVEKEVRQCLTATVRKVARPPRSLHADGVLSVWFDSNRFFEAVPKNPAAEARYQQLRRHLGFDVLLHVLPAGPDKLNIVADYNYQMDRFGQQGMATASELLNTLGTGENAGIAGRLMDRCANTLEYDSLIERLRSAFGGKGPDGVQAVVVEKSFVTARDARFVLTARCDAKTQPPILTAFQTLWH